MFTRACLGVTLLALVATAAVVAQSSPAPPERQAQPPTFRSAIDLVTIEATIVDRTGRPVPGLAAADFEVLVDDRPRRIVSVEYFDATTGSGRSAKAGPGARSGFSTNEADDSGVPPERLIILAFDHSSFTPFGAHPAIESAKRFLATLDPSDRVAFAAFPAPDVFVSPTVDRRPIEQALSRVVGTADATMGVSHVAVGLGEAVDIVGGDSFAFNKAFDRECRTGTPSAMDLKACADELSANAQFMVQMIQMRTTRSLQSLSALVDSYRSIPGRKTLVLVSSGLFSSSGRALENYSAAIRAVGDAAASANMAVHVLHLATGFTDAFGADRQGLSPSLGQDQMLLGAGLEDLASVSGGALARVPTGADFAFDRIAREISAYYALAIETAPEDRDGRPHRLTVRTARPGVEVRSRQRFTVDAAPENASPDEQIAAVLRSGRTVRDLPIRVATQTVKDASSDRVRVIVRADVGRGVADPAEIRVGLAFFDSSGELASSSLDRKRLESVSGSDVSWTFAGAVVLPAGVYTLRTAVMGPDGRVGSVTHRVDATLGQVDGARTSDLLVFDPGSAGDSAPPIGGRIRGSRLAAYLEVYPEKPTTVTRVEFAIADGSGAAPIFRRPGHLTRPDSARTQSEAEFDLALLPPGDYELGATVFAGDTLLGRVARPITVDRPVAGAGVESGAASVRAPRLRFTPGESGALGRRFSREDVLRPDALVYFLARLRAADPKASLAPVAAALEAAEQGKFDAVIESLKGADAADLAVPFLRGLSLLQQGKLNEAAGEFRAAVEIASDFLPAAFYLGACFAAGNQDEHAIGAWQTALISEEDSRIIYDLLTDAYLRLRNGPQALATLTEARERWPTDDLFLPRMAVAQSMMGESVRALDTLESYLSRHGDDADTLFLALRLLYETHASGASIRTASEDADLAARFGSQYKAASGPNLALADRWVAFVKQSAARKR